MAARRAIVASDLPSIQEVLKDGEHALLVAPGDPSALAAALRNLADDRELGERLAQAAFAESRATPGAAAPNGSRRCSRTVLAA